jgi:hypothetical protein
MNIYELQVSYVVGAINELQFYLSLDDVIITTTNQDELTYIFWMIIDWEEKLKEGKRGSFAPICHYDACITYSKNEYAPAMLRKYVKAFANTRPLPENLKTLYPRQLDDVKRA